jgi:hypothetical protein
LPSVRIRRHLALAGALIGLLAVPPASATPPPRTLSVGASESVGLVPDVVTAKAKMDLAKLAGLDTIAVTTSWAQDETAPSAYEVAALQTAAAAANLDAIDLVVTVGTGGGRETPVTAAARAQYTQYLAALAQAVPSVHAFVVGNEPNLNRFWMPQFGPRGRDLAAPAYEALLAQSYDALKAVSPQIEVIGGAVSPRGGDNPHAPRQTHSPTRFLLDLGRAYRASGRSLPIMDTLSIHPYGETSRTPPTFRHPKATSISIADYDKLVKLLRQAFRGTAQPGAKLPIVYAEYGVQTQIPPDKLSAYTNLGTPTAADAVSEALQGAYYKQAIRLAYCQPTVKGLLFFHVTDEADLDRWQSGLYYADDTPKSDLPLVQQNAAAAEAGLLPRCPRSRPRARR